MDYIPFLAQAPELARSSAARVRHSTLRWRKPAAKRCAGGCHLRVTRFVASSVSAGMGLGAVASAAESLRGPRSAAGRMDPDGRLHGGGGGGTYLLCHHLVPPSKRLHLARPRRCWETASRRQVQLWRCRCWWARFYVWWFGVESKLRRLCGFQCFHHVLGSHHAAAGPTSLDGRQYSQRQHYSYHWRRGRDLQFPVLCASVQPGKWPVFAEVARCAVTALPSCVFGSRRLQSRGLRYWW